MAISGNGAQATCIRIGDTLATIAPVEQPCAGGGVYSTQDDDPTVHQTAHTFADVDVIGNNGPGIIANGSFTLSECSLQKNVGPGAVRTNGVSNGDGIGVLADIGLAVTGNLGPGIVSELGRVELGSGPATITGNGGAGIRTVTDAVDITVANDGSTGRTTISNNGTGPCTEWSLDGNLTPAKTGTPCRTGGITVELDGPRSTVTGNSFDVRDNHGDGIDATSVTLRDVTVCHNSGGQIVAHQRSLDHVDVCTGGGGCEVAGGAAHTPWSLLLLLGALLFVRFVRPRRRRRSPESPS